MADARRFRSVAVLILGLLLLWTLPLPYSRVGGIGNYDCWRFGLLGWAHWERLQPSFRWFEDSGAARIEFDRTSIALTAVASVVLMGWLLWRSQRRRLATRGNGGDEGTTHFPRQHGDRGAGP